MVGGEYRNFRIDMGFWGYIGGLLWGFVDMVEVGGDFCGCFRVGRKVRGY